MEVNTMVSYGTARLMNHIREVITTPITRRKGLSTKCVVEILNEDGTTDRTFSSISEALRETFGRSRNNTSYIYRMVAFGKARLVYRSEEEDEEEGEEEVFYDALDQQGWMGEEVFYYG